MDEPSESEEVEIIEILPDKIRAAAAEIAPFPAENMEINVARWDQWQMGYVPTKTLRKASGGPLIKSPAKAARGVREEECRPILARAVDQGQHEVEGSCQTRVKVKEEIKVLKERIDG